MTNTDIRRIISMANTNESIHWSIAKNTDTEIVLTNDYDKCVNYSIRVKHDDDDEWIVVKDNHMNSTVTMLCKGLNFWDDYAVTEHGLALAVEAAVKNFNSTY